MVETALKIFPEQGLFQLGGPEIILIPYDYTGGNLRCCYCFSYRHLAFRCNRPWPSFFLTMVDSTVPSTVPALLSEDPAVGRAQLLQGASQEGVLQGEGGLTRTVSGDSCVPLSPSNSQSSTS